MLECLLASAEPPEEVFLFWWVGGDLEQLCLWEGSQQVACQHVKCMYTLLPGDCCWDCILMVYVNESTEKVLIATFFWSEKDIMGLYIKEDCFH